MSESYYKEKELVKLLLIQYHVLKIVIDIRQATCCGCNLCSFKL